MSEQPRVRPDPALALLELYGTALPQVYGYLLTRCRDRTLAQDLTAETFRPGPRRVPRGLRDMLFPHTRGGASQSLYLPVSAPDAVDATVRGAIEVGARLERAPADRDGAGLGWRFSPGEVEDGWRIEGDDGWRPDCVVCHDRFCLLVMVARCGRSGSLS